jgi:hypothetical protein
MGSNEENELQRPLYEDLPARVIPWARFILLLAILPWVCGTILSFGTFFIGPVISQWQSPMAVTVAEVLAVEPDPEANARWLTTYRYTVGGESFTKESLARETAPMPGEKILIEYFPQAPKVSYLHEFDTSRFLLMGLIITFLPAVFMPLMVLMPFLMLPSKFQAAVITREGSRLTAVLRHRDSWLSPALWAAVVLLWIAIEYGSQHLRRPAWRVVESPWYETPLLVAAVFGIYIVLLLLFRLGLKWLSSRSFTLRHTDPALILDPDARTLTLAEFYTTSNRRNLYRTLPLAAKDRLVILAATEGCSKWPWWRLRTASQLAILHSAENRAELLPFQPYADVDVLKPVVDEFNLALGEPVEPPVYWRRIIPVYLLEHWALVPVITARLNRRLELFFAIAALIFAIFLAKEVFRSLSEALTAIAGGKTFYDELSHFGFSMTFAAMLLAALAVVINAAHFLWLRHRWPNGEQDFPFKVAPLARPKKPYPAPLP